MKKHAVRALLMLLVVAGSSAAQGLSTKWEELTGPEIHDAKDYRGTHGQLPSRADMRSCLIVYGASARVGAKMALARMIDIGPTAAALLGLSFSDAEGIPIAELLKPGVIPPRDPGQKKKKTTKNNGFYQRESVELLAPINAWK